LQRCQRNRLARAQQAPQVRFHRGLALLGRQVQQTEVFPVRLGHVLGYQRVIGHAEHARGKQLLPIAVLGERSRLPHQPVNDVPIVHPLLASAPQPRLPLDQLLRVPHLHLLGIQADLDVLADQPARHRVTIALHVNQAALVHTTTSPLARFQPPSRQGPQHGQLFRQPGTPAGVELFRQPVQKTAVLLPARKIPTIP
jgi:hypothetical protein